MKKLLILNSREIKKLRELVMNSFGYFFKKDHVYLKNDKEKIFIVNKDITRINLDNLIIDRMGLYFAELKDSQCRLSKEGAQFLVREAKEDQEEVRNLVELEEAEIKTYFAGADLDKDLGENNHLIIITFKDNVLGCAQYKNGKILNFLPKIHRGEVII